jgi:hypothetical protein
MQSGPPGYRPKPPSQGTAETLILVAFVIQIVISLIWIFIGFLAVAAGAFFLFFGVVGAALILLAAVITILPILMLFIAYQYSYRRVRDGDLAGARGPTLLLGILGIPFGAVIVGILYLVAYFEIGSAETELRSMGVPSGPYGNVYGNPYGSPYGYHPPAYGQAGVLYAPPPVPVAPPAPASCPRCGRPATFIPQYGRSYCYSCAQYV